MQLIVETCRLIARPTAIGLAWHPPDWLFWPVFLMALVESKLVLLANVSHPHHAHWGLPNDRTTCGARKRPHQGKITRVSSFKLLVRALLTGARRCPTAIKPLAWKTHWPTGHRHEGLLANTTCPSGTPRWARNENEVPLCTALTHLTMVPDSPLRPGTAPNRRDSWAILLQHTTNKETKRLSEPTHITMCTCETVRAHDHCHDVLYCLVRRDTKTSDF